MTGCRLGRRRFRVWKGVPDLLPCVFSVSVSSSSKLFLALPGGSCPPPPSRSLRGSGCPGFLIGRAGSRGSPRPLHRLPADRSHLWAGRATWREPGQAEGPWQAHEWRGKSNYVSNREGASHGARVGGQQAPDGCPLPGAAAWATSAVEPAARGATAPPCRGSTLAASPRQPGFPGQRPRAESSLVAFSVPEPAACPATPTERVALRPVSLGPPGTSGHLAKARRTDGRMDGPQGRCGSGRSMMPKAGPRGQRPDSPRSPFLPGPRWPFQGPGGRGLPRERGRAEVSPQLRQHLCRWPCSSVLLPSRTADNRKRQPRRAGNVLCAHAGHRAAPEAKASVAAPRPGSPLPAPGGGQGGCGVTGLGLLRWLDQTLTQWQVTPP